MPTSRQATENGIGNSFSRPRRQAVRDRNLPLPGQAYRRRSGSFSPPYGGVPIPIPQGMRGGSTDGRARSLQGPLMPLGRTANPAAGIEPGPPRYTTYRYSTHPTAMMIDRAARARARRSLVIPASPVLRSWRGKRPWPPDQGRASRSQASSSPAQWYPKRLLP